MAILAADTPVERAAFARARPSWMTKCTAGILCTPEHRLCRPPYMELLLADPLRCRDRPEAREERLAVRSIRHDFPPSIPLSITAQS